MMMVAVSIDQLLGCIFDYMLGEWKLLENCLFVELNCLFDSSLTIIIIVKIIMENNYREMLFIII